MSQTLQAVSAELYVEVQTFYARQIRLLDARRVEEFAATFTEDGVMRHAAQDDVPRGRDAIVAALRTNLPRYDGFAVRHWFDKLLVKQLEDGRIWASYYAIISRTDADRTVTFDPSVTVEDILVRRNGQLLNESRTLHRDVP